MAINRTLPVTQNIIDSIRQLRHTSPVAEIRLDSPLQYVKGVGPRKAEVLTKQGLNTVEHLLFYFPRQYLDRTTVVAIGQIQVDRPVTIIGQVRAHGMLYGRRKRYEVILADKTGAVSLIWFQGLTYLPRLFKKGQWLAATGTVTYFMGHQMVHPDLERIDDDSGRMIHAGRIIPVYPQTAELNKVGLNSKSLRRLTTFVFENLVQKLPDPVPKELCLLHGLPSLPDAVRMLHYPQDRGEVEAGRRRLAFDELLFLQFLVHTSRQEKEAAVKRHRYETPGSILRDFVDHLPFELTEGQRKSLREIFKDLQSERAMARMLQGDVGCGKTVVAVLAALYVALNKLQVAFMAPTEILAEQHFRNWQGPLEKAGIRSELLTSRLTKPRKKKVAAACGSGDIDILFGTHALIYDYVTFNRLGLVIIDEQHRFGVKQRSRLHAKGDNPDLLVMTATPIPRTLALTLYGDLDISTIDTMPAGRKPIRTVWRTRDVRDRVYGFVMDEIAKGHQAYFIYPIIEKSERIELENVEDAFEELRSGVFKTGRVGMIHGRIKPKDRDEVLERFRSGELDILMATTVVEVGMDNPNATVMIIEHAERFGLAQLHQLRGRIGRSDKQATLIAIAHPPLSDVANRRLEYFANTTDGFEIAEADLELRGPGEIFGTRQSGLPELRVTRLSQDRDLLEIARSVLDRLFLEYHKLDSGHRSLYMYLRKKAASRDFAPRGG